MSRGQGVKPSIEIFLSLSPTQQVALLATHDTGLTRAAAAVMVRSGAVEPSCDTLYALVTMRLLTRSRKRELVTTQTGAALAEIGARHVTRLNNIHHVITGTSRHVDPPPAAARKPRALQMRFARCTCGWDFALAGNLDNKQGLVARAGRDHLAAVGVAS